MAASISNWTVTSALLKGVESINKIDGTKFILIANRIIKALSSEIGEPFSDEEKEKLQSSLEITSDEVQQLISTITHIFNQVIYFIIKPPVLQKHLVENLHMEEERAMALTQLWSTEAESLVNLKKQQSVHSHQLSSVDWSVNVAIKSDDIEQDLEPRAEIKLNMKNNEDILLDLNSKELSKFYNLLENIQTKLDSLQ